MAREITPPIAAKAILTTLTLAETYRRWDLFTAILRYVRDAGARVVNVDGVWMMEYPQPPSKETQ